MRTSRKKGESGIYHIVNRGVGQLLLFEEVGDYCYFINKLKMYVQQESVDVLAYCLMNNHIHLLLKTDGDLSDIIKKVAGSYAVYYNQKYERSGHLFQGRYYSEPVDSEPYLLQVINYIHQNPEKAGIGRRDSYPWSSWQEYTSRSTFISTDLLFSLIGGRDHFLEYASQDIDDRQGYFLDITSKVKLTDREALDFIHKELGIENPMQIQSFDPDQRSNILRELKKKHLSIRQIARLTGVSKKIISKI